MEPICEAKFSDNSYGFRPMRSVENAIHATYNRLQLSKLHFVIEFDIKSFFDEVNHSKLIKQIWAMGIRDTHLIYVLKQILKAPIRMPDGNIFYPTKGTPQGGIISPLLANIVLNELDHWIESQWENNPIAIKHGHIDKKDGHVNKYSAYRTMRGTNLKEMYIIRYADDFRIFCSSKKDADKILLATTQWLEKRLKLQVSNEKTKIVNVKEKYSEFLGFKIKVHKKADKYVVKSHISDKNQIRIKKALKEQAKNIANPRRHKTERQEIALYNSMVTGIYNYYCIATGINPDCNAINRHVMTILTNRLGTQRGQRLVKRGRTLTNYERSKYGKSAMLRYVAGSNEPIYPIGYVQYKNPCAKRRKACPYTAEGREDIHDNLRINIHMMMELMQAPSFGKSVEYMDNRISLFSAQFGKCSITGREFADITDIHCHHKKPKSMGGNDKYENLTLVIKPVHKLIHATREQTILYYIKILNLTKEQTEKINIFRKMAGLTAITV